MDFSKNQKTKIKNMITKGEKMDKIATEIGENCTWQDIQKFCWETGSTSWQGSKTIISRRLAKFEAAGTQEERKKLANEIDTRVSYLYFCAKEMRSHLVKVKKAIKGIS